MRARTGSSHITSVDAISLVSGKAGAATSHMTIAGTVGDSGTSVAILAITVAVAIHVITIATTAAASEVLTDLFA